MVFMQGTNPLNRSTAFGVHAGYLYTGSWFETHSISLPAGLNSNDVVMAYYDGSYNFLAKQGGTVLEGAAIDGEGKWHTITLTSPDHWQPTSILAEWCATRTSVPAQYARSH